MKTTIVCSLALVVLLLSSALPASAEMSGDNYRITSSVLSAGGGSAASDSYETAASLGQSSATGTSSGSSYSNYAGFWQPILAVIAMGDVNGDGEIDLTDAVLTLQVLIGIDTSSIFRAADVNGDGKISMAEVFYVLQNVSATRH